MEVSQPLDHITHAVIGGGKTIDFGISNDAEFFQILSATLYTDQILAVVREVLCNAWDAHIEAGITDKPVEVTLNKEYLTIRDFGLGIPHDKIGPVYAVYGESTKKRDGKQTGGFGLGCKAPFAYTDHFEVISHHAGVKTIYNMSKSNAQAQGKPGIVTLMQMPTTEQGLSVKIPIKVGDHGRFTDLIQRITRNGEMLVRLNNQIQDVLFFSKAQDGYFITTQRVHEDRKLTYFLRYGTVIYPLNKADEYANLYTKMEEVFGRIIRHNSEYSLILQAPPDSITVTPSRESLSLQEHTVKTVKSLLRKFIENTNGLNDEILSQGKRLINEAATSKKVRALLSREDKFPGSIVHANRTMTTVADMARFLLAAKYPEGIEFRKKDLQYRIERATQEALIDKHLAKTYVENFDQVTVMPVKYNGFANQRNSTGWLHRKVLGKLMVKLDKAGLDMTGLKVFDPAESYIIAEQIKSAKEVWGRHHLQNLPFLHKFIIVTTSMGGLKERLSAFRRAHLELQIPEAMLIYHIRSRKAGLNDVAIPLLKNLGYEVIDFTRRQSWEGPAPVREKVERKKYEGLPALSCIGDDEAIDIRKSREANAPLNPKPEFSIIVSTRGSDYWTIEGFTKKSTKALVALYGDRAGIAKDMTAYKRALKNGAKDMLKHLEEEITQALTTAPEFLEYWPFDFGRVWSDFANRTADHEALELIYNTPELRNEFSLKNNLTKEQLLFLFVYRHNQALDPAVKTVVENALKNLPLAPENKLAVKAVTNNDLVELLDIQRIERGLKTPKRQVYLDIFLKALKG